MVDTTFPPPILSYEDINECVEQFLKDQHPSGALPVPIEDIVDLNLKPKGSSISI